METLPDSTEQEQWRPIVGWESLYEVSGKGRVRRITDRRGVKPGGILKPRRQADRYLSVKLCGPEGKRYERLHRVVALAFLGPRPPGFVINHKDGDRYNNDADNLEYVTPEVNRQHAITLGISRRYSSWKLSEEDVRQIRKLSQTRGAREIAAMFHINYWHALAVIKRHAWKHVE